MGVFPRCGFTLVVLFVVGSAADQHLHQRRSLHLSDPTPKTTFDQEARQTLSEVLAGEREHLVNSKFGMSSSVWAHMSAGFAGIQPWHMPVSAWCGLGFVMVLGVGLSMIHTAAEDRSPAALVICDTLHGPKSLPGTFTENAMPAVAVALVSIPLSLALGIASGAEPMTGIATAVIGGIVSGLFGSSAFNIVGPAGALVGILIRYTTVYGVEVLPWLSLFSAGLMVISLALRLHDYCLFMPKSVFEGFTVGIALTIGLSQFDFALGLRPGPPPHPEGVELSPVVFRLVAALQALDTVHVESAVLFIAGTASMLLLYRWKASVPWMVPFAAAALVIGMLCDPDGLGLVNSDLPTLRSRYGAMPAWFARPLMPLEDVIHKGAAHGGSYLDVFVGSASVAFVAILETLISAKLAAVATGMHFNPEIELEGLALSHLACGFCGIMPPTGVFVRTNVNRVSGATHKLSQLTHALLVLVLAGFFMPFVAYLPLAAVAAILVTASIRMTPLGFISSLAREHPRSCALLATVALVSFFIDSVAGLLIGTVAALLGSAKETGCGHAEISVSMDGSSDMVAIDAQVFDAAGGPQKSKRLERRASTIFKSELERRPSVERRSFRRGSSTFAGLGRGREGEATPPKLTKPHLAERSERVYLYTVFGQIDFLNAEKHIERINAIAHANPHAIVLSLQNVPWIDVDGLAALEGGVAACRACDVDIYFAGIRAAVQEQLELDTWFSDLAKQEPPRILPTTAAALEAASPQDGSSPRGASSLEDGISQSDSGIL